MRQKWLQRLESPIFWANNHSTRRRTIDVQMSNIKAQTGHYLQQTCGISFANTNENENEKSVVL